MRMDVWDKVAYVLLLIGGLNWGLVGLFDYNLVTALFGEESALTEIVYVLVGLAAVYIGYKMYMVKGKKG